MYVCMVQVMWMIQMILDQTLRFSFQNCLEQQTQLIFNGSILELYMDSTYESENPYLETQRD